MLNFWTKVLHRHLLFCFAVAQSQPPSTTATASSTASTTTSSNQSGLQTNATPTEKIIIGGRDSSQQPIFPPPPQYNKTQHTVTTATPLVTNGLREPSPIPVRNSPRASPRGISPVENKQEKDLMSFESVSAQLIAAASHNPFPNHKPYPTKLSTNIGKQPSSMPAKLAGDQNQSSNPQSNVDSGSQVSDDLIVLDTLKASKLMKHQLPSSDMIGPFEKDMLVVDRASSNSSPHPPGIVAPSSVGVATRVTNNSTTSNASQFPQSSPRQQPVSKAPSHISTNQTTPLRGDQLAYRDGFGVSHSDVRCVEAIQAWVKAEMALAKGDKAVALLAYKKVSGEH